MFVYLNAACDTNTNANSFAQISISSWFNLFFSLSKCYCHTLQESFTCLLTNSLVPFLPSWAIWATLVGVTFIVVLVQVQVQVQDVCVFTLCCLGTCDYTWSHLVITSLLSLSQCYTFAEELSLESNELNGTIPIKISNLSNLSKF